MSVTRMARRGTEHALINGTYVMLFLQTEAVADHTPRLRTQPISSDHLVRQVAQCGFLAEMPSIRMSSGPINTSIITQQTTIVACLKAYGEHGVSPHDTSLVLSTFEVPQHHLRTTMHT